MSNKANTEFPRLIDLTVSELTCLQKKKKQVLWKSNKDVAPDFPYWSYRNDTGEIVYCVPLEAPNDIPIDEDAEEEEKHTYTFLPFFGGCSKRVYFIETTDRAAAYIQKAWLNSEHWRDLNDRRRTVKVDEDALETDGCVWDGMIRSSAEVKSSLSAEELAVGACNVEEIRKLADSRDQRIWECCTRLYAGESIDSVGEQFGVSKWQIYKLLGTMKKIIKKYQKENA